MGVGGERVLVTEVHSPDVTVVQMTDRIVGETDEKANEC